jgi:glycosyltransferase involved in cell wall biosynthesis
MAISDRVDFLGWQDYASVWRILQRADLLVLPTVREGFPSVLLEAAAAELPIVTTPVGGIPDHFKDGVHAVFVAPGAPAQLARAILELLGDPARRARMGLANRMLVREFASDRVIPEYLRVFRELADCLCRVSEPRLERGAAAGQICRAHLARSGRS